MKRIKNWCASYRQHTLPQRRVASRSKPPKPAQNPHRGPNWRRMDQAQRIRQNPAPGGQNWPLYVSRRIAWRRIHYGCEGNVAFCSGGGGIAVNRDLWYKGKFIF
nr:hypothetical protein [Methylomarinum sp. Ch1-1]MDP4521164.1 hypothetical protein [Methylomarinum sp. Ch1-1]